MMTEKDKNKKNRKINLPTYIKVIVGMTILTLFVFLINRYFNSQVVYALATQEKEDIAIKEYKKIENEINLEEVIKQNQDNQEEKIEIEEMDLEYTTIYENNVELPKGMIQVLQEGKTGTQQAIYLKQYENGELIKDEQIGSKVIGSSIDKIVQVGTGNYNNNYKVKVGDTLYVTSNTLDVRSQKTVDSEKVIVLNQKDEVKLLSIDEQWYEIAYGNYIGWVQKDCVTYWTPSTKQEEVNSVAGQSKSTLVSKLSINMKLNQPSGLTLEQFKKVLSNNEKDKNKILQNNAEYFYYIEKQYDINGIFVAAVAIHESNWGTSKLATSKNNLFGYGAYDRDPYNSAYSFAKHSEGIDLLGRVFVKYYLHPSGTKIYGQEIATGKYYNGPTLKGVNTKYATDKNWSNKVYEWMKYLYNRL